MDLWLQLTGAPVLAHSTGHFVAGVPSDDKQEVPGGGLSTKRPLTMDPNVDQTKWPDQQPDVTSVPGSSQKVRRTISFEETLSQTQMEVTPKSSPPKPASPAAPGGVPQQPAQLADKDVKAHLEVKDALYWKWLGTI